MGSRVTTPVLAWQSELAMRETRNPSWVLRALVAPAAFWLGLNMWSRFQPAMIVKSSLALGVLVFYASCCFLALKTLWPHRAGNRRSDILARLVLVQYSSITLFWLSAASLSVAVLGMENLPLLEAASGTIGAAWFALIGGAAIAIAPGAVRVSEKGRSEMAAREVKWLPYALGCQGLLVGIGVFLGAFLMRGSGHSGVLFVSGLSLLGSGLLEFFGVIGSCRFIILATGTKQASSTPS